MDSKSQSRTNTPHLPQHWSEKFGHIARFPKTPSEIRSPKDRAKEPRVFLRERKKYVDIVIRLSASSRIFPPKTRKELAKMGITPSQAFEDILWMPLETNTAWADLTRLSSEAYDRAWLHLFDLLYVGHFHPVTDRWLKELKADITRGAKIAHRGRRPATQAENCRE